MTHTEMQIKTLLAMRFKIDISNRRWLKNLERKDIFFVYLHLKAGLGSTGDAAEELNRSFIGCEIALSILGQQRVKLKKETVDWGG